MRIILFQRFCVISFVLVAAVCGCNPPKSDTVKKDTYENVQLLRFRWRKKLYSNIPDFKIPEFYEKYDRFAPIETGAAAFDTEAERIFIGAAIGGLYCLSAESGETVWRYTLDDPVGSTPVYDSARHAVYFGADDGYLYRVQSRSGRLIWKVDTGAELRRTVHMSDDTIFVVNADNTVLAVDPEGGEIVWRYHRDPVEGFSSVGYSDLRISGAHLLVGFSDGFVVSLDKGTGVMNWSVDLATDAVADADADDVLLVDVDATPLVTGKTVIAASLAGGAYGLDLETGNVRWIRSDITKVTGAAVLNGESYLVRAGNRGLVSIDPKNGQTTLEMTFGVGLKADPVAYDDVLIVSDSEAGMYFISAGTGRILNLLDMDGGFFARPVEFRGYMVILGNWSTVFSFAIN